MSLLFKANNVSGGYRNNTIIKGVSFEIEKGDFLGIIGPNGSGKSTLLKLAGRVITLKEGEFLFEGKNTANIPLRQLCRKMAFVSQDTAVNFSYSAEEVVLMGRIPYLGRFESESKKDFNIVYNALSLAGCLNLKDRDINELSAGERQRVIIAKALAQEPVLLFLDEPTAHLDIGYQLRVMDLLKSLNEKENLTIVIVLHDLNLAAEYCRKLILLNEGKVFSSGAVREVLTYQNIEKVYDTAAVVENNPFSGKPYVMPFSSRVK